MKWTENIGAPALVTAVDIATEKFAPEWNQWAAYGLAIVGYGSQWTRYGNDFLLKTGIAAAPVALKELYGRVTDWAGIGRTARTSGRLTMRPIQKRSSGTRIATAKPQFAGTRLY
jgi:hypothetical protein